MRLAEVDEGFLSPYAALYRVAVNKTSTASADGDGVVAGVSDGSQETGVLVFEDGTGRSTASGGRLQSARMLTVSKACIAPPTRLLGFG